jgi:crotonobetainyl-CoA:carnitine CoA-transferase CaiB-like acyl-CoA transferase
MLVTSCQDKEKKIMAQTSFETHNDELVYEPEVVENETRKASKEKVELAKRISERDEIGGYVTSKHAAQLLSQATNRDIPVTTVNNLAYAGKLEAFRIGGIFLFKLHGEKSVTAYIPTLSNAATAKIQRQEEKSNKANAKNAVLQFKQWVNYAIKKNIDPSPTNPAYTAWLEEQEHAQEE